MTTLTLKTELSDTLKEKLAKLAGKQDEKSDSDNSENKESKALLKPLSHHHYGDSTHTHKKKNKAKNQQQQSKQVKQPKSLKPQQPKKKKGKSDEEVAIVLQQQQNESQKFLQQAKDWLMATYPKVINWDNPKPLAIGIHRKINWTTCPVGTRQRKKALQVYTNSIAYQSAILGNHLRYDLEGNPIEAVTPEHQQHAIKKLAQFQLTESIRANGGDEDIISSGNPIRVNGTIADENQFWSLFDKE